MSQKDTTEALSRLRDYYFFSFVVPDKLAGMSKPERDALDLLRKADIPGIITLTEEPIPEHLLQGFEYLHLPVPDFTAPDIESLDHAVGFIEYVNGPVVVHCFAGRGRTGTVLAAYLVSTGLSSDEAIYRIRKLRPYSIETDEQEAVVHQYEYEITKDGHEND